MKRNFFLLLVLELLSSITPVFGADGDPHTASKPVTVIYALLFFIMNSLQELFEVLIFVLIWKEFFHILQIRSGVKN